MGDPAREIVRIAGAEHVDLVAMATHGHRGLSDLLHGTTVNQVRHEVGVPGAPRPGPGQVALDGRAHVPPGIASRPALG